MNNKDNIIYKAYIKLKDKFDIISGIKVILNKRIPMEAGLAGGSTDCASFILGMNQLFDLQLSKEEMENIGQSLGADVVPCFYNRAILAEGIGEIITKIDTSFKYYLIIIKPQFSCNTGKMFKKIDERGYIKQQQNAQEVIKALESNNLKLIADNLYNTFEEVIENKEQIDIMKNELKNNGALASLLAGSGSCVYGIFEDKEKAKKAYYNLKKHYQTFICTSYNSRKG